ncbi:hypothetical protein [Shimia ponticola]|uniref:hypothetical protein n=1 Tax=Shimia ponticola TaxID=2582893 RepID=UPI0011BF6AAE|nr:hypothetical protein [Shimia ponticola]
MQRFVLILLCAGCTQFPALDGTISPEVADADYVPFIELDDMDNTTQPADQVVTDPLATRAAALSRRADVLRRRSVLSPDLRARIRDNRTRP